MRKSKMNVYCARIFTAFVKRLIDFLVCAWTFFKIIQKKLLASLFLYKSSSFPERLKFLEKKGQKCITQSTSKGKQSIIADEKVYNCTLCIYEM